MGLMVLEKVTNKSINETLSPYKQLQESFPSFKLCDNDTKHYFIVTDWLVSLWYPIKKPHLNNQIFSFIRLATGKKAIIQNNQSR